MDEYNRRISLIEIDDDNFINYSNNLFKSIFLVKIERKEDIAFCGLLFLCYFTFKLRNKLNYEENKFWESIIEAIDQDETYPFKNDFIKECFPNNNSPSTKFYEMLKTTFSKYKLRNTFDDDDNNFYYRNSLLLQIGVHSKWKMNISNLPKTISILLISNSENYSETFIDGWRTLLTYTNTLENKKRLECNPFFKDIINDSKNFERLLKNISKQRILSLSEIRSNELGFKVIRYKYDKDKLYAILSLSLNNIDELDLIGNYRIYNNDKIVDKFELLGFLQEIEIKFELNNSTNFREVFTVYNNEQKSIFSQEVVLFDYSNGYLLFNIHGDYFYYENQHNFKPTKLIYAMMYKELNCNLNNERINYYFNNEVKLAYNIDAADNFKILFNSFTLFENSTLNTEIVDNIDLSLKNINIIKLDDLGVNDICCKVKIFNGAENISEEITKIYDSCFNEVLFSYDKNNSDTLKIKLTNSLIFYNKISVQFKHKRRKYQRTLNLNLIFDGKFCLLKNDMESFKLLMHTDAILYDEFIESEIRFIGFKQEIVNLFNKYLTGVVKFNPNKIQKFSRTFLGQNILPNYGEEISIIEDEMYKEILFKFSLTSTNGCIADINNNFIAVKPVFFNYALNDIKIIAIDKNMEFKEIFFSTTNPDKILLEVCLDDFDGLSIIYCKNNQFTNIGYWLNDVDINKYVVNKKHEEFAFLLQCHLNIFSNYLRYQIKALLNDNLDFFIKVLSIDTVFNVKTEKKNLAGLLNYLISIMPLDMETQTFYKDPLRFFSSNMDVFENIIEFNLISHTPGLSLLFINACKEHPNIISKKILYGITQYIEQGYCSNNENCSVENVMQYLDIFTNKQRKSALIKNNLLMLHLLSYKMTHSDIISCVKKYLN